MSRLLIAPVAPRCLLQVGALADCRKQLLDPLEIELTRNPRSRKQWTDPKETVVDGRPFEVYECKSDGLPVLEDIDQLSGVVTTARTEGTDCRTAIAIFGSDTQLSILARGWRLSEEIHGYATSQLLELAAGSPDRPLTPRLGPGST